MKSLPLLLAIITTPISYAAQPAVTATNKAPASESGRKVRGQLDVVNVPVIGGVIGVGASGIFPMASSDEQLLTNSGRKALSYLLSCGYWETNVLFVTISGLSLGAGLKYDFASSSDVHAYAMSGFALHTLSIGLGDESKSESGLGIDLGAGFESERRESMNFFAEYRIRKVVGASLNTLSGGVLFAL